MSISRWFLTAVGVVATLTTAAVVPGCGSSAFSTGPIELRGEYDATGPGPLLAITFFDETTYSVKWNKVCANEAYCTDWGSYVADTTNNVVTLTSAMTGETQELPFAVLETETVSTMSEERLQVLGNVSLTGSQGGALTDNSGASLAGDRA